MYYFTITITSLATGELHEFTYNDLSLMFGLREIQRDIEEKYLHLMDTDNTSIKITYFKG